MRQISEAEKHSLIEMFPRLFSKPACAGAPYLVNNLNGLAVDPFQDLRIVHLMEKEFCGKVSCFDDVDPATPAGKYFIALARLTELMDVCMFMASAELRCSALLRAGGKESLTPAPPPETVNTST